MKFRETELAILFTLAYTDQFDFPLTETEIWQRLIRMGQGSEEEKKPPTRSDFKKSLLRLALQKQIVFEKGFICLAGRSAVVQKRLDRTAIALEKSKEIAQFKKIVEKIPLIQAAFITGSVAMDNADEDDDLDILILAKKNRLWICRLVLLFATWGMGKKKSRTDEGKFGWCLNLWLDEDHLAVDPKKRDLYQAYEVCQALPVFGRAEVISKFYQANNWTAHYLPNFDKTFETELADPNAAKQPNTVFLGDWLESLAYHFQLWYMKSHQTSEKVGPGFAFFHPRPTGKLVKDGLLHSLRSIKNSESLGTIASTYVSHLFAKSVSTAPRAR